MPLEIPVKISGFGPSFSAVQNRSDFSYFSTSDILRAAVVAGYGYKLDTVKIDWRIRAWRVASIRLALDFPPSDFFSVINRRLAHPRAWRQLDPCEKAAVSNLLGNVITKLLCESILDAPRLWFLDLYRDKFSVELNGRNRPDFFTRTRAGRWVSLEAKGRANAPSEKSLNSAKTQAEALVAINGENVQARVVCWTMARDGHVAARFHDPTPEEKGGSIRVDLDKLISDYYAPIREIIEVSKPVQYSNKLTLYRFDAGDFLIGFHPRLQHLLDSKRPNGRSEIFRVERDDFDRIDNIVPGPDGIILIPGQSWPEDR